ncbi:MAG: hypothetical protein JJU12_03745 [Chlamydiales bacterium]|nr:hypothetical protein [Chlamydiales bacterium]
MADTGGIGGEGSKVPPSESPGVGGVPGGPGGPSGGSIENALHTRVATLGQLKQVLVDNLGEKEGTKLYNGFVKSLAMQILGQVQQSAEQAKKAARQMREGPQG